MEIQNLKDDIKVFYVKAPSFPAGISDAHSKLHSLLPSTEGRKFFGISHGSQNGSIIYKAAVEESYQGEAEKYGLETFTIKRGDYISDTLVDWQKDESIVRKTFQRLLHQPNIDKNGYCLEVYVNEKDMVCMVKLDSDK